MAASNGTDFWSTVERVASGWPEAERNRRHLPTKETSLGNSGDVSLRIQREIVSIFEG